MHSGKQDVVEALRKHSREAMAKAKEFRERAASQTTKEEADLYLQQAREEEAKADGYLRHAETLKQMEL